MRFPRGSMQTETFTRKILPCPFGGKNLASVWEKGPAWGLETPKQGKTHILLSLLLFAIYRGVCLPMLYQRVYKV